MKESTGERIAKGIGHKNESQIAWEIDEALRVYEERQRFYDTDVMCAGCGKSMPQVNLLVCAGCYQRREP